MRTFTREELETILLKHRKWLANEEGGERADLRSANLRSADLSSANLSLADLSSADLSLADLSLANLRSANLRSADLSSANLSLADLSSADLRLANLRSADLRLANLRSADLRSANLRSAKEDFFRVLELAKPEVVFLYKALLDGRVDGSVYNGECACLKGTLANARHCAPEKLGEGLELNVDTPAESWFLGIRKGDTPEGSQISVITVEWITEFMKAHEIAIPTRTVTWSA